jgi:hypothetical protein
MEAKLVLMARDDGLSETKRGGDNGGSVAESNRRALSTGHEAAGRASLAPPGRGQPRSKVPVRRPRGCPLSARPCGPGPPQRSDLASRQPAREPRA